MEARPLARSHGGRRPDHRAPALRHDHHDEGEEEEGLTTDYNRTSMPRPARCSLASRRVKVPSWKIEAARTASAPPLVTASARCSSWPAPPLAMTGTRTAA